jgi:hypothetical protein
MPGKASRGLAVFSDATCNITGLTANSAPVAGKDAQSQLKSQDSEQETWFPTVFL